MYRNINDFLNEWGYETTSTLNIFKHIQNENLSRKDNDHIRSMAVLAWHITITLSEMMNKAGLPVVGPDEHSKAPTRIEEIISVYEVSAASVAEQVKLSWKDEDLQEQVNMYGEMWTKGTVLSVLIKHQAHHRGQLTILMRLAGYKVPGVYGPSKEEWASMNIPAPE